MTHRPDRWDALGSEAFSVLLKCISAETQAGLQQSGLMTVSSHWFYLIAPVTLSPEPVSAPDLIYAFPYTAPKKLKESLQILSVQGYLKPVGHLQYAATDKGIQALDVVIHAQRQAFQRLSSQNEIPFEKAKGARLVILLMRLVDAVRALEDIPKPTFNYSAVRPMTDEMPFMEIITRTLGLLNRFRVDMHNATWRLDNTLKGIDGIQWETLSLIWQGKARTPAAISELLPYRGYRKSDYSAAIKKLLKRGWLTGTDEGYHLTDTALHIRRSSEARTAQLFYRAWDILSGEETTELDLLLESLLNAMAGAPHG
jgi:DNA-binding MarR family transcriptional regulator